MAPDYSTITIRAELKERLHLLKGRRTWDEFLEQLAEDYPTEDVVAELQRRLDDLRTGRVKGVPWGEVKATEDRRAHRKRARNRARARRSRRS